MKAWWEGITRGIKTKMSKLLPDRSDEALWEECRHPDLTLPAGSSTATFAGWSRVSEREESPVASAFWL